MRIEKARKSDKGFTLIECMVAMVITMIGVLATIALMAVGIRMQVVARDSTAANAHARAKIEQLQNFSHAATQRARGGDLTTNVANYNDVVDGRYRRRWRIEHHPTDAGVPASTQRITVVIVPEIPGTLMPAVQITALVPGA